MSVKTANILNYLQNLLDRMKKLLRQFDSNFCCTSGSYRFFYTKVNELFNFACCHGNFPRVFRLKLSGSYLSELLLF